MKEQKNILSEKGKELKTEIINRKKDITELDLNNAQEFDVAVSCLNEQPILAMEFDVNNSLHLRVLKEWVNQKYENYLFLLKCNISHPDLIRIYLYYKLKKEISNNEDLTFFNSMDHNMAMYYKYETKKGETIGYFDKALGIPTVLKLKAVLKIKFVDLYKLAIKIDMETTELNLDNVIYFVNGVINNGIRDVIIDYITSRNLKYFDLSRYYTEINKKIADRLNETLKDAGIVIAEFRLSDISIPDNTSALLEEQYFILAKEERQKEYECRVNKMSLELYEKKAEIHNRYPEFPITLTETEKDFALDRYLKRTNIYKEKKSGIIKADTLTGRKGPSGGTAEVAPVANKPIAPKMPEKKKKFKKIYYASIGVGVVISLLLMIASWIATVVALGVVIVGAVVVGILKKDAIKNGVMDPEAKRQYEEAMNKYNREMENYTKLTQGRNDIDLKKETAAAGTAEIVTERASDEPEKTDDDAEKESEQDMEDEDVS